MKALDFSAYILSGKGDGTLAFIYEKDEIAAQRKRYSDAAKSYADTFGNDDIRVFSVPGRSEISGNHTDHNNGKVLAAAINLDIIAIVSKTGGDCVRVKSAGYNEDKVYLADVDKPREEQRFKSKSLIAGMLAGFKKNGHKVCAFNAFTTNNVHKGSGLSSSAAFECMIGNILNHLANEGKVSSPEIARIAQFSENVYFGKPCGLMDQTACAVGGFVSIDFENASDPVIKPVAFDLSAHGYSLCIVNTGGNHSDLNDDYASIPAEMKAVAAYFGKPVLRGLTESEIIENIPVLRKAVGDRAIMRAMHFIAENKRVEKQTQALLSDDIETFFEGAKESGDSSFKYLQNVYTVKNVSEQGLSLALCVTEYITKNYGGAFRVHGGGFAGTIQAFIPADKTAEYKAVMDSMFGEGACAPLKIRAAGAVELIF